MHQIVSDDVLTSLSVHSDAVTDRAIIPRRGESLRGVITRKSTHTIVPFGFVTYAAANFNFHAALVAVSEHGTFTVSGLPSGGDLILTYHAVSWFDDWTPYHWSVGTNEQHTVQASVRLPQTKEVTIEVPDELLNER